MGFFDRSLNTVHQNIVRHLMMLRDRDEYRSELRRMLMGNRLMLTGFQSPETHKEIISKLLETLSDDQLSPDHGIAPDGSKIDWVQPEDDAELMKIINDAEAALRKAGIE